MKEIVGVVAIILVFVAYVPYIQATRSGKTKPHIYSWFIWGILSVLVTALQFSEGAGFAAYVTLATAILTLSVFLLGLPNGKKDITALDTVFLLTAVIAMVLWLFAQQPLSAMVLLVGAGVIGLFPTIRKSWHKPHEETLFMWALNSLRHALTIGAIMEYNAITLLAPVTWTIVNAYFSLLLLARLRAIAST